MLYFITINETFMYVLLLCTTTFQYLTDALYVFSIEINNVYINYHTFVYYSKIAASL